MINWNPWKGCRKCSEGCRFCTSQGIVKKKGVEELVFEKTKEFEAPIEKDKNSEYKIPSGETYYEAEFWLDIPEDVDPGEYHFMIRVTDASGWQQLRSVSIRLD